MSTPHAVDGGIDIETHAEAVHGVQRAARPCVACAGQHGPTVAGAADLDALTDLLADAFAGHPWTQWLVAARRLRAQLRADLGVGGLPYGTVRVARCPDGGSRPVGASVALGPDRPVRRHAGAPVAQGAPEDGRP